MITETQTISAPEVSHREAPAGTGNLLVLLYTFTTFLSAFLLFLVQPVIARMVLPWFGGSSAVWTLCMLFFQTGLLAGYAYAHGISRLLSPRQQAAVHSVLLLGSFFLLPIVPNAAWKPVDAGAPSLRILLLLTCTIGLPYFLLSATSPLIQSWYARTHRGAVPYRLFSLSNLASLLSLLSYPFVVEPYLSVRTQAWSWSAGYAAFAVLCAATAWTCSSKSTHDFRLRSGSREDLAPPSVSTRVLWVMLAACASILLLSVTNYLTQDVASIPFLWILPLGAYLLTFVLCFESDRYYRRPLFFKLSGMALIVAGFLLTRDKALGHAIYPIAFLAVALFVWCMTCHGELARLKPNPRYLTTFYLMVSVGGALGGLLVGLVAPALFNGYWEFPTGLALIGCLMTTVLWREGKLIATRGQMAAAVLLTAMFVLLWAGVYSSLKGCRLVVRNFYGQLRVQDSEGARKLFHGVITHGLQPLDPADRHRATSYYYPESGVGKALTNTAGKRRVGILGLGCGTLSSYRKEGDEFRFYEINPLVVDVAHSEFGLPGVAALGDARLLLEGEQPQNFDVLVVDVFSGDSIPVHLLTREAFGIYFNHLRPDGVLAVHISNQHLNLEPVVAGAAQAYGKTAVVFDSIPREDQTFCYRAVWVLVTAQPRFTGGRPAESKPNFRVWTDDYSSLFSVLR